jgi:DNA-binding IclR family transcriptional regulator
MKDAHMHVLTPESRVLDSLDDTRSTDFAQVLRRSGLTASRCREALDTLIKLHLVSRVHYRTKYLYQKRKGQTVAA